MSDWLYRSPPEAAAIEKWLRGIEGRRQMSDYAKLIEEAQSYALRYGRTGLVEEIIAALKDTLARAERAEAELESLATPAGWSNIQSRPAALFVQDRIDKAEAERDSAMRVSQDRKDQVDRLLTTHHQTCAERDKWRELAREAELSMRHVGQALPALSGAAKRWLAKLRELEAE